MTKKERALIVCEELKKIYPEAICQLNADTPFQLLVATRLSAQCTDARVNLITPALFEKYPDDNTYHPVLKANEFEEGTGHHSMIKEDGQWYAIYHARDYDDGLNASAFDARNARICKLNVEDGIITAERYKDHI